MGHQCPLLCLEKITLYGFEGENEAEINNQISKAAEELGNPVMRYFPKSISYNQNSRAIDREIINQLRKAPRANLSDIAKEMINKVRSMEEKSEVMVIYDYDFFSG